MICFFALSWWTALLALFGLADTATKEGLKAREAKQDEKDLAESARILDEATRADEEHKRGHEP